jgi:hypothetical protein
MCCVIICWWPSRALGVEARGEAASVGGGEEGFPPIFECAPVVGSGVAGWLVGVHEPDCGGEGDRVFDGVAGGGVDGQLSGEFESARVEGEFFCEVAVVRGEDAGKFRRCSLRRVEKMPNRLIYAHNEPIYVFYGNYR